MNNSVKNIIQDARAQVFSVLILLWITYVVKEPSWQVIIYPLYSIILFSLLDLSITFIKTKKLYYPFSSLVSGLLIGFLIHYSQGIIILTLSVIIAYLSKQFLRIKNRDVFNPAALGVVISTFFLRSTVSWWATASGGISLVLILPVTYVLYKLKRFQFTLIFLAGYFIFFTIIQGYKTALTLTVDGTVFLFAFIFLTEPMTSSISKFWKWGFGLVVLVILIINYLLKLSFTDPLLFALLITNLIVKLPPPIDFFKPTKLML